MPRFFVSPNLLCESKILLTGEQATHAKVLRLNAGDCVTLCDGQGHDAHCTVTAVYPDQLLLDVHEILPSRSEPNLCCSIYMGFPKADKFEHVIQKATELGAFELIAFPCSRSISRPDHKSLSKKLERWNKIAVSAAEQSGRGRIPNVLVLDSFQSAVDRASRADLALLLYENEDNLSLRNAAESKVFSSAAIMTGPEGGFTSQEVAAASFAGMSVCTLGSRILRCETAPLCALSALMYAAGELE